MTLSCHVVDILTVYKSFKHTTWHLHRRHVYITNRCIINSNLDSQAIHRACFVRIEDDACSSRENKLGQKVSKSYNGFETVTKALVYIWSNFIFVCCGSESVPRQHAAYAPHMFYACLNIQIQRWIRSKFSLSMQYSNMHGFSNDLCMNESISVRQTFFCVFSFEYRISKIIFGPFFRDFDFWIIRWEWGLILFSKKLFFSVLNIRAKRDDTAEWDDLNWRVTPIGFSN